MQVDLALENLPAEQKRIRAECLNMRSGCHIEAKRYTEALTAAELATNEDTTYGYGWNTRATALYDLTRYSECIPCYSKALQCGSMSPADARETEKDIEDAKQKVAEGKDGEVRELPIACLPVNSCPLPRFTPTVLLRLTSSSLRRGGWTAL